MSSLKYRLENKDKIREKDHRYYLKNKKKIIENVTRWKAAHPGKGPEYSKTWRSRNPEKARNDTRYFRSINPLSNAAHIRLQRAVASGKIIKPKKCSCGRQNPMGHHDDYLRPLDVQWLCYRCHSLLHSKIKREKIA